MKQRILAALPFIIAALAALITLFATDKHIDETNRYSEQYTRSITALKLLAASANGKSNFDRVGYVISVSDQANTAIANARVSLDYFEKLKPPGKLRSEHRDILAEIDSERVFIDKL